VLVAHCFTADERITRPRVLGTLIGLGGVSVMMGPDAMAGLEGDTVAQLACVGAAVSYAFAGVYGRRFGDVPPLVTATGQLTAASAMLVPLAALADAPWTRTPPAARTWAAVIGIALVSTALGYVLYFRILATAGATNVLLVTLLIPVTATALGVMILGETLEPRQLVGMALIGAGLAVVDGRLGRVAGLRRARADGYPARPV
jgi:drug/metabolite transporter (DMT)-like permease